MTKEKIAVLGGGVGAMSAVWGLTSQPDWDKKYEITVYQLGWRLGGKGASGRGPDGRIQEHGLHIWMGFYDNAFRVMREAFGELQSTPRVYQSVEDAFKPQSKIGVMEHINGAWKPWVIPFPKLPGEPGTGAPHQYDDIFDLVRIAIKDILGMIKLLLEGKQTLGRSGTASAAVEGMAEAPAKGFVGEAEEWVELKLGTVEGSAVDTAHKALDALEAGWHEDEDNHDHLVSLLDQAGKEIEGVLDTAPESRALPELDLDTDLRRLYLILDLGQATLKGLVANYFFGIRTGGLDALDKYDLSEFFKKYGAKKSSYDVFESAPVRAFYDLVFGYEGGDPKQPNFSAGPALRSIFSILLLYKNSVFMKMRAGMGDTIFAPLHKALEARGVKFEFFHRLTDMTLETTSNGKAVGALKFAVQATPKSGCYNPYVEIDGLDCWPQAPLVDQLVEGDALLKGPDGNGSEGWDGNWKGYDLEDFWTTWTDAGTKTLTLGTDFDHVILGIPPAAHPFICPDLVANSPRWQNMVRSVGSVRTQALQVWLKSSVSGLGWTYGSAVVDAFQQPLNTWADMTHLVNREDWPISASLGSIAYFCGPMKGDIPSPGTRDVTQKANAQVCKTANDWLHSAPGAIWPSSSDASGALEKGELVRGKFQGGSDLTSGQYWRANVSPSERYVMSLKGTAADRLKAGESGLGNLVFAGDWTQNTFNAGCVEASVMSGLLASNALSGWPSKDKITTYWAAPD